VKQNFDVPNRERIPLALIQCWDKMQFLNPTYVLTTEFYRVNGIGFSVHSM
jgi:hypothetical protein